MNFLFNRNQEKLKAYREALEAYANPKNWGNVGSYGKIHPRRWIGGGNGIELARKVLEETK
ncbi:MAG: hypothetical protein ACRCZS_21030 [Chroococcidiopsis sp.]